MNRAPFFVVVALGAALVALSTTTYAQEDTTHLAPVLDGTHMDNMMVDMEGDSLREGWGSVVLNMDSSSAEVLEALSQEQSEGVMGYRVGLFFDNSGSARARAQAAVALCDSLYGDVLTTLSYANPYFKVSAGYCTTLEEALMLLNRMQRSFPSAFLINERVMPSHLVAVRDRELAWADTLRIRREMKSIDEDVARALADQVND